MFINHVHQLRRNLDETGENQRALKLTKWVITATARTFTDVCVAPKHYIFNDML